MAKRAKKVASAREQGPKGKVGRPKGSVNAKADSSLIKQFKKLAFETQANVLQRLTGIFQSTRETRAAQLLNELKMLGVDANGSTSRALSGGRKSPLAGRKAEPKYRSKVDPSLTWAGRGQIPRWMREEMKATKLKKEDFAIS